VGARRIDQINVVVADVAAGAAFLRALGVDVPEPGGEWAAWAPHHQGVPAADDGFDIDLDSREFAVHWGGVPHDFTGVVLNVRTDERKEVDATFEAALGLGAEGLRSPYDAFWGARYALVAAPGPLMVGIMSPIEAQHRREPPSIGEFA
jgi:hypothetical protein